MKQLTVKQEAFIHAYCANGGNGQQAAIAAGYAESSAYQRAHELVNNSEIHDAIETFRAENAAKAGITVENQTRELEKDRKLARENGQVSAAIQATGLILKAHGLLTEDRKNERNPLVDAMQHIAEREKEKRLH